MSLNAKIQYEQVIMTISSLIKMQVNPKAKRWVFTWNNPPDNWQDILKNGISSNTWKKEYIKFLIAEKEYGEKRGTKHIQGYFELNRKLYRNTIYNIFIPAYLEVAKGTQLDNIKYCTKTGVDIVEIGERTMETEKWCSKLDKTKKMLEDLMKTPWLEFSDKYPLEAMNRRSQLLQWKFDHTKTLPPWSGDLKKKNIWIWGPPRTGKSKWARKQVEEEKICFKWQNKWWDGYEEGTHKLVLIEDMNPEKSKLLIDHLKVWCDRYCFSGEVKGGAIKVNPGRYFFIVTSNHSIVECFSNTNDLEAIKERFSEVYIGTPNDIFLSTMLDKSIITT